MRIIHFVKEQAYGPISTLLFFALPHRSASAVPNRGCSRMDDRAHALAGHDGLGHRTARFQFDVDHAQLDRQHIEHDGMALDVTSPNLGTQSQTQQPTITGSCSATFNALFNPTNYQATVSDITFNLQQPGEVSLENRDICTGMEGLWCYRRERERQHQQRGVVARHHFTAYDSQRRSVCRESGFNCFQRRQLCL